ncbi:fumarylacetoacetate hydrolase family protein [Leifsonia sp. LS-T14]|uniref:fumarylacetoacetate hydrolase family protein n=1 Tax=unclassified Leifsonia TaxID=2663824 RepID=UPI0035A62BA4
MRFARVGDAGREVPVVEAEGRLFDLRPITGDIDGPFLAAGTANVQQRLREGSLPELDAAGSRRGAPIARPGKVLCIGLNYRDHAAETGAAIPDEPILFMKDPSTVIGPHDDILIPRGSVKTDWEVELGVVIGRTARYLSSPDDALEHVAGYVLCNDVSEREFQLERGGQWDKGKSCETFNPLGPVLVTADEIEDPQALGMRLWVGDEQKQDGTSADMIFSVAHIVWYLSQFLVLRPGDLINTGTPAGVALGARDAVYLRPGDRVACEIDGLGRAENAVVAA